MAGLSRAQLLARTARGGAVLAVGGGALAAGAPSASAGIGEADVPVVTLALAAELGLLLETVFLGIYLGGVASLQDPDTRALFARIAASQAEHLSLFSHIVLDKPIGMSFPVPLSLEDGSAALDPFIS